MWSIDRRAGRLVQIREADSPVRRAFRDPRELHAWLYELLKQRA
ncbi:MAG TPA: hypothetical protein VGH28_14715 [Polyangiaceae bacterium]